MGPGEGEGEGVNQSPKGKRVEEKKKRGQDLNHPSQRAGGILNRTSNRTEIRFILYMDFFF